MYSSIFVAFLATLTLAVGPQIDGYTRSDPGTSAISVPVKGGCSTFISHSVYEGTTLDAARCTAECDDSCDDCRFVNTWMELKDGQPTRQICALYTTSYTDADATSKSYTRPSDNAVVTVGSSACYSKTDAPSSVDSKCVVDGPVPYPPVVKSCPSKNRQGSGSASSSSNGGSGSASSGSSNGGSSSASSGSSNGGSDSASGSSNDGSGSASGPSNGGSGSVPGSSNGDSGSASGSSDGASGGSPSGAYTTKVVDQFTTYCPSPTTITYGPSQTYVVTEAGSITITDCPCTITKPVYGGGAVPTDGADGGSPPYYGGGGGDGSDNGNGGDGGDNGDGGDGDPTDPNDGGDPTDPNDGGDGDPTDDTSSTTTGSTATASSTTDTALSTTDTASSTTETASSTTETASSTTETASSTTGIASSTTGIGIASSTTGTATGTTTSTSATSTPTDCVQAGGTCSGLLGSNGLLLSDDCCDGSSCFATLDINARSLKGGSLLRRQTLLGTCSGGNPDDGTCNAAGDACDATRALGLDPCCAGSTCTTLGLTLNGLAVVVDQCVANEPVTGPFNCATDETEQCCTASAANALQLLCTAPSSTDISSCGTQPAYCCPNDGVLNILNGVVYTGCQAAPGDGEDGGDSNGANGDVTFTCTNGEARCCTDADGLGLNLLCTGLEGDGTCSANQTPSCCDGDQTLGAVLALNCAAPATTTPVEGGGGNSPTTFACAANYDPTCCPASAITGGLGVGAVCQDPTNSACANTLFAEPLCCPTGGLLDPLLASQCFVPGSEPGVIATSFGCTGADTRQCCPAGTVSELGALCTEATTDDTATCSSLLGGSSAFCCSNTVLGIGGLLSTGCDPAGIVV